MRGAWARQCSVDRVVAALRAGQRLVFLAQLYCLLLARCQHILHFLMEFEIINDSCINLIVFCKNGV